MSNSLVSWIIIEHQGNTSLANPKSKVKATYIKVSLLVKSVFLRLK